MKIEALNGFVHTGFAACGHDMLVDDRGLAKRSVMREGFLTAWLWVPVEGGSIHGASRGGCGRQ